MDELKHAGLTVNVVWPNDIQKKSERIGDLNDRQAGEQEGNQVTLDKEHSVKVMKKCCELMVYDKLLLTRMSRRALRAWVKRTRLSASHVQIGVRKLQRKMQVARNSSMPLDSTHHDQGQSIEISAGNRFAAEMRTTSPRLIRRVEEGRL